MKLSGPFLSALAVVTVFSAGGCSTPAQPAAMVPPPTKAVTTHAYRLSLQVVGGSETKVITNSQISNSDFASAVRDSILQSELFSQVSAVGTPADYVLAAFIARLAQPTMGTSLTVTFEVGWKLTRIADKTVVWEKAITKIHRTGAFDAFAFTKRLRLANEAAARANIADAIAQMGSLKL